MPEGPTPTTWSDLRAQKPIVEDALATLSAVVDGAETDVLYGMDQRGDIHLLIPVHGGPTAQKPPDLRGLRVRHRQLALGQYLDMEASACHEPIFSPLCAEVLAAVIGQKRKPWEAVGATIRAWQSAWRPAIPAMERTVQVGLFGELLTMEYLMIPAIGTRAVFHWSGPDSERHDFVGTTLHLEVKTTRKGRHEHEISRLDQLRVPAGRSLAVVSILVEESVTGTDSLATRVDRVIDLLRGDSAACDDFLTKMGRIGWTEEMRSSGEMLRFHLRGDGYFAVDATFPRLSDDFCPPSGVVAVRYTVDLANLPSLDMTEAREPVKAGFCA